MVRIADLSEDYSLDAAALAERGVRTVDELWECISRNVDQGVTRVALQTGIERHVLLAFLIAEALDDPKRSYKPRPLGLWLGLKPVWTIAKRFGNSIKQVFQSRGAIWSKIKEHKLGLNLFWLTPKWLRGEAQRIWGTRGPLWPDLLLLGLPVLLIGLVLRAQQLDQGVVKRVAVVSGATLPAFAAIDTSKLTTRPVIDEAGSFASIDDLRQRYPLRDLAPGELVNDKQLVPSALSGSLTGRRLFSLPIRNSNSVDSAQPMDRVKLIFAPRDKDKTGVISEDAIYLALSKDGEAKFVRVALVESEASRIQDLLGTCDIFVSHTLR